MSSGLQLVEIGRLVDELGLDELRDELVAPLEDVLRADPAMDAALDERAALEVRQTRYSPRRVSVSLHAGARRRDLGGLAVLDDDLLDVRDDVVAARHQHLVADADAEALDVRDVVEHARCTTAPPSSTGATIATGVTRPVGPGVPVDLDDAC